MSYDDLNVKEQTDTEALSEEFTKYLSDLKKRVDHDRDNRIGWLNKLITASNQRLGVKRVAARPYPGAPNIPLPEVDKIINKQKPNYVLSAITAKQKAFVQVAEGVEETPDLKAKAKRAEKGLNWVLNNKIDLIDLFNVASDNFLEKGHCVFKVVEKFEQKKIRKVLKISEYPKDVVDSLRRARKEELVIFVADRFGLDAEDEDDIKVINEVVDKFKRRDEVIEFWIEKTESYPDILVRPPEKVTPPSWGMEIEKLERMTDEYYLTRRELEEGAECGRYDKSIIDRLKEISLSGKGKSQSADDLIDTNKNQNEGITDEGEDELFRCQEVCAWVKLDSWKGWERWIFTFLADVSAIEDSVIQKIRFPYELDTWNYVKHDAETKDKRYHSARGVPERIRALHEFQERSVNNMLIRDEINNNPLYTVLANSSIQQSTVRFIPGQKIKVKSHTEIARLDDRNIVDQSSERLAQLLKAYSEEYVGSTDQLFRNATNKGGGKTLGEIQVGMQQASGPAQLEVLRWLNTLKKVYTMVFKLMADRLGDSIFIDGNEITREDFNFPANIVPNGSIDLVDQNLRTQKAMARLQFTLMAPPDIVDAEDKYNAAFDWLESDGVTNPDRYVTNPGIIMQRNQQQMQAEDQVLQQQEAQMDSDIRQKKAEAMMGAQQEQQMAQGATA